MKVEHRIEDRIDGDSTGYLDLVLDTKGKYPDLVHVSLMVPSDEKKESFQGNTLRISLKQLVGFVSTADEAVRYRE